MSIHELRIELYCIVPRLLKTEPRSIQEADARGCRLIRVILRNAPGEAEPVNQTAVWGIS